ncbi:MAG: hypothetical protein WA688_07360 [Thermoplasmata archaeon]
MKLDSRLVKLLPALCVCAVMVLGSGPILSAIGDGHSNANSVPAPPGIGPSPFIAEGGSTAEACDDVATCTTGAVANVDAGDTLVVIVTEYTTSAGHPSLVEEVTSGGDNDLSLLGVTPCITGSGHGVTAIYGLADVGAESSVTFTANYAAAEYYTIHALDVEGTATSPFETAGTGVCSTAAGTTATAAVTTTVANDLVILGVEVRASTTISATGGDTLVTDAATTGAELDSGAMLDEIDTATGSISLSATFTSASWSAIAVALKPATSPPPPLVSGTVSPSSVAIDAGQAVELTTTPATGGTEPITYQWYASTSTTTCSSGTLISGATGVSYTTPALSAGTYFYCVWATDSSTPTPQVVYSNVATITVNPALSVTITPSAPSIDSGQAVQLTANPSGGTGADTYTWYVGSTCSGTVLATTQSYTTAALTSTTTYCVAVTDSSSTPATTTSTVTVKVSSSPLTVTISPSAPSIDSGQTVQLTANPAGGTGADTYAWYSGGSCTGTVVGSTQAYTTPVLTASTAYCVAATDSAYSPVTATATATVTVSSSPLAVTISPSAPSIDNQQSVQLTANPTGGTGADTYAWYEGSSCTGPAVGTTQVYSTSALTATTTYCVAVTDSAYSPDTATATATVTVSASPLMVTISPSAPSIDSGQGVGLTANPSGGTGADTYAWFSGTACSGTVLATSRVYTTPALTASSPYCVAATDSAYAPVTATATVSVTVSSSPLSVTITPSAPSISSGQTVQLTANPSGGTGPDTYAWYSGGACSGTMLATTQVYTTPGLTVSTTYCVAVTDSAYTPATATATATVTVGGTAFTVSITPSAPAIDSGQTAQLTAHPSGGTGADTYAWYSGAGCTGSVEGTAQVYESPALTETANFCVAATDSAPVPATTTATATVTVSASRLTVTITPVAPSIDSGQTVQLTAHPSGGTGSDTYAWYAGAACSGTVLATTQAYTTPELTASSTYCVAATDRAYTPATATASAAVAVDASAGPRASPPMYEYPALAILVALLIVALLMAVLLRRGREVTFTETGLPEGTEWSVKLEGSEQHSTTATIAFRKTKGEHPYTVGTVPGYTRTPAAGTVDVGKDPVRIPVEFEGRSE